MIRNAVVVVTGGASGIGLALARRFAAEGARCVVIADLDGQRAAQAAASLPASAGTPHRGIALNAADPVALAEMVRSIEAEVAPIDVWCGNAGLAAGWGLGGDDDWAISWDVHVMAHVHAARIVLPGMLERGHGHFMITSSAAGLLTEMDVAPYAVTKHGAVALAEWLAIRHRGSGVGFSCLCPQGVRTALLEDAPANSSTVAAGPLLEPDEVAESVMRALAEGRFLILPHPQVARYMQNRADDPDRWIAGMHKVWARLNPKPVTG